MELRTDSDQIDVLAFYDQTDMKVSTYSEEEVQWYGQDANPDIVRPKIVGAPIATEKKRGRPRKEVVTEI